MDVCLFKIDSGYINLKWNLQFNETHTLNSFLMVSISYLLPKFDKITAKGTIFKLCAAIL